eukprot:GEMP01024800.1.p1 GENE.GEMP01024800.1~~GEMP01024800.1.p1  ORF type:complete len:538 (+),score=100.51 GEMP01024800.1:79-1692(+)
MSHNSKSNKSNKPTMSPALLETHEWPLGLKKRNNLNIPRGTVFQVEQTQPVPKLNGMTDPPGVYEYAVVGYYGRETKYLVVEAGEHSDGDDQYTFTIFSEKEILEALEKRLHRALRTFSNCKRPLPGCDHTGFLIITPWDPPPSDSSSDDEYQDEDTGSPSDSQLVGPDYEPWPQGLQRKNNLDIERGTIFIFNQIHQKCEFSTSRLNFYVKTPGKGSEACKNSLHEYIVAGYDPREDKYYCYEADSNPLCAVLFSKNAIQRALKNMDKLISENRVSFEMVFPTMPEIDNNFKVVKPSTMPLISAKDARMADAFARKSERRTSPSFLPPSSPVSGDNRRMSAQFFQPFDHDDPNNRAADYSMPMRGISGDHLSDARSKSPTMMERRSVSPLSRSPRNTYAESHTPERVEFRRLYTEPLKSPRVSAATWLCGPEENTASQSSSRQILPLTPALISCAPLSPRHRGISNYKPPVQYQPSHSSYNVPLPVSPRGYQVAPSYFQRNCCYPAEPPVGANYPPPLPARANVKATQWLQPERPN